MGILTGIKMHGIDGNGLEQEFELDKIEEPIVLYFYPKDNTPGCTKEACNFRDSFNRLTGKATVIGVSPDSIESHKKFRMDHSLNFILLSDTDRKLAQKFDALEEVGEHNARINRSTFIIKDGEVTDAWKDVKVEGHVDEVLKKL